MSGRRSRDCVSWLTSPFSGREVMSVHLWMVLVVHGDALAGQLRLEVSVRVGNGTLECLARSHGRGSSRAALAEESLPGAQYLTKAH